ncbi:MAG: RNA polymerase sigma factor [Candidatus Eremiobacteraeota bacterium]|nr:RNA polymerase sigma factor [Candidatus Eremiobacteraeota bacterium]
MRDPNASIEAVWRIESTRLIATLARMVRDVGLAEDLAQDALVAALERWPQDGIPRNPGAWLLAVAKHRAIDQFRRYQRLERKRDDLGRALNSEAPAPDFADLIDGDIGDDVLRLMFITCHPVLPTEGRVALTLRLLGGLTTDEIARAFLVPKATVAQRILRAKKTLAESGASFEVPSEHERAQRFASVMEVVYLIFNEGYAATSGGDWVRPALCDDALRLGRIFAALAPQEPEAAGLIALMELQASRLRARVDPDGTPVLLLDQDRGRWDRLLIRRGLSGLERAQRLRPTMGPYTLQAAIAACHARAWRPEDTDWERIVALYDALAQLQPSPVIDLNRAMAVAMAFGPAAGLSLVDDLAREPALQQYHLLPSVRGDLLFRLGRYAEAGREFERAAAMTSNAAERKLNADRAAAALEKAAS